jgi:hypothetical protein
MCVLLSPAALQTMTPPFILQEYLNHDGVIIKTYVVGKVSFSKSKGSFPNLSTDAQKYEQVKGDANAKFELDNKLSGDEQVKAWRKSEYGSFVCESTFFILYVFYICFNSKA